MGKTCYFALRMTDSAPCGARFAHAIKVTSKLWEDRAFTDCTITCKGQSLQCHRAVLSAASPVFGRMLDSGMREGNARSVDIGDAEPKAVGILLEFLYLGDLSVASRDDPAALLELAHRFQVGEVVSACSKILVDSIAAANVVSVTRTLRCFKESSEVSSSWVNLREKLRNNPELFDAVLCGL